MTRFILTHKKNDNERRHSRRSIGMLATRSERGRELFFLNYNYRVSKGTFLKNKFCYIKKIINDLVHLGNKEIFLIF